MNFYILPKHVFEQIEKGNCPDGADPCTPKGYENVPSVGSGPFTIAEYEIGEFVRMERNPNWTGPEPAIDEIIYRSFRNDDALSQALKQGEVDFAYFTTPNIFNSSINQANIGAMTGSIPSFSADRRQHRLRVPGGHGPFTPHGDGHPALTDVIVRQAMRMAINSEELIEKVSSVRHRRVTRSLRRVRSRARDGNDRGRGDRLGHPGGEPAARGRRVRDWDGDGVREMPDGSLEPGRPLEFRYYTRTSEQTSVDAAPFVSEWLGQIGIATKVKAVSSGRLGDIINAGTYDMYSWGWYPSRTRTAVLSWINSDQRPPDGARTGTTTRTTATPSTTRCTRAAAGTRREAVEDRARDAEDLLRGCGVLGHVVRPVLPWR